jgi:hypothetical protein
MPGNSVPAIGPTGVPPYVPPIPGIPPTVLTVLEFFYYLNKRDLQDLMGTFSTVNNAASYPRVGITSYGPQFIGYTAVQRLFRQLISSFNPIALTPQGPPYDPQDTGSTWLFNSPNASIPVVGVQVNFSGSQVGSWFAEGTPYYSPPLSNIVPNGNRAMDLDACAIFSFDPENNDISQASIYFDRYLMSQQLTP